MPQQEKVTRGVDASGMICETRSGFGGGSERVRQTLDYDG